MLPSEIATIILQVVLIATFIGVFFFTYASKIEKEIVEDQMDYIVKDIVNNIKIFIPENKRKDVSDFIKNMTIPDMKREDKLVDDMNKGLLNKAVIVLSILVIVGVIAVYIMSIKYNFTLMPIIKESLIVLAFVGLTEFVFLRYIGKNYRSGDPNIVKYELINSFQKFAQSN